MLDRESAPAKVNLFLHVVGRRPDGYHLLDSLVVFAGVGDVVEAHAGEVASPWSLAVTGPHGAGLEDGAGNLVSRAASALATAAAPPLRLVLHKHLPVAAGIGGGSADAAATLRLLRRVLPTAPDPTALAARLGADVPVCLAGRPTRMRGIGERLDEAPALPSFGLVLLNPGVAVSTQSVFAARTGAFSGEAALPPAWRSAREMAADLARLGNDLEEPAQVVAPAVAVALQRLRQTPGCLLARMSGSGATCFGLFETPWLAERAAVGLAGPGWWVWGGAPADGLLAA